MSYTVDRPLGPTNVEHVKTYCKLAGSRGRILECSHVRTNGLQGLTDFFEIVSIAVDGRRYPVRIHRRQAAGVLEALAAFVDETGEERG